MQEVDSDVSDWGQEERRQQRARVRQEERARAQAAEVSLFECPL
jgi:hypothetical protein